MGRLCPAGTKAVGNECIPCEPGTYQSKDGQTTCVPCDADRGEFQTEEGSSYCETTKPGYQPNEGNTTANPVKCKKDYFSGGRVKVCARCPVQNGEYSYTDFEGSSFCFLGPEGVDFPPNCPAL